ncbi:MAG TPA: transglutaminase, partial [Methanobacteriales archaeon]|nr:transglutaminase [Methanobacteriales archaeon]
YGHVWAQIHIGGTWYNADATSTRNSLGVINNWNTATGTILGTYASLPF